MGLLYDTNEKITAIAEKAVEINVGDDENPKIELVNSETGELLTDEFKKLNLKKSNIMLSLAKEIKNLKAKENALKAESESFRKRAKSAESKRKQFEYIIKKYGYGETFEDGQAVVAWRKSPLKVEILNEDEIPREYGKESKFSPDITRIKQALKAGEIVKGCVLTRSDDSLIIR
jgi:hypothetical protein